MVSGDRLAVWLRHVVPVLLIAGVVLAPAGTSVAGVHVHGEGVVTSDGTGGGVRAVDPTPTIVPWDDPSTTGPSDGTAGGPFVTPEPDPEPEPTPRPEPPPTGQNHAVMIERGESGRVEVALTFDAGAGAGYTSSMLDVLAAYDIVATFGITGEWAIANPDLVSRIVAEGHMILNHSWDHASFTGASTQTEALDEAERTVQIVDAEAAIVEIGDGYEVQPWFRFPYGDYDMDALRLLGTLGYSYSIWWSCDTLAWMGSSAAEIVERCGPEASGGGLGAIILLHVADPADWRALEPLILAYRDAGYDFVTIEQLVQP